MQIKFGLASILPETKVFGYIEADGEGDVVFTEADETPVVTTTHSVGPISLTETRPYEGPLHGPFPLRPREGEAPDTPRKSDRVKECEGIPGMSALPSKWLSDLDEIYKHVKSDLGAIKEPYHHGYANGVILAHATIFGHEADFLEAPKKDEESPTYSAEEVMNNALRQSVAANAVLREELNAALVENQALTNQRNEARKYADDTGLRRLVNERNDFAAQIEFLKRLNDGFVERDAKLTEQVREEMKLHDGTKSQLSYAIKERDEANDKAKRLDQIIIRHSAEMREVREQLRKTTAERNNAREGNLKYFGQVNGLETDVKRLTDDVRHYESKSENWLKAYHALRTEFEAFIAAARKVANQTPSAMVMDAPPPPKPWGSVPPAPIGYVPPQPAPAPITPSAMGFAPGSGY